MSLEQVIDFIHSVALLLSIGLFYDIISTRHKSRFPYSRRIVTGLAFSLIGIIIMSTPWEFAPGYFFDPRTVVTLISGLFFGYITTGITMISLSLFRLYEGGGGVLPGIFWVIIPGVSGLLWNRLRSGEKGRFSIKELYILSLIVHVLVLLSLFSLGIEKGLELNRIVALPILLIFPTGATLLGALLTARFERRLTEKKVTQLAAVIEQLNEKIIITDLKGHPIYLNKYFEESTGYSIEEVLGRSLGYYKSGRQKEDFYKNLWQTISSGHTWRGQIINRRKDQSLYYDEATIFPIINDEGEIINYASFQRDITDQIELIKALENSEDNLKTILNSIGDAVLALDYGGRIFDMNPPAEEMAGGSRVEIIGKVFSSVMKFKNPQTGLPPADPVATVLNEGSLDDSYKHLEFNNLTVSMTGTPIRGEDDIPSGVVLVIRDISEEEKMRNLMMRNEKMLSIGGLAAGMAHEINNPLAGMMQTADVISGRIGSNLNSPTNRKAAEKAGVSLEALEQFMEERGIFRMLKSIKSSGRKAAAIIENMISFSQSGEDTQDYYNPVEILDTTLDLMKQDRELQTNYRFNSIDIKRNYEEALPPLYCNRSKIQQVFHNVLRNAAQALEEGAVESPVISIRIYSEGVSSVIFEIADNGPGMSFSVSRHAFEPFYTTSDVGSGTGLGLSVSYYIIAEEHGGDMTIQSEPGKGTTVLISLPM